MSKYFFPAKYFLGEGVGNGHWVMGNGAIGNGQWAIGNGQ
jgi:hypothetical protein